MAVDMGHLLIAWVEDLTDVFGNRPPTNGGCHEIVEKTVLVTGANRSVGHAPVEEASGRGAKRIYAGTGRSGRVNGGSMEQFGFGAYRCCTSQKHVGCQNSGLSL